MDWLYLIGRVLLSMIFIFSGFAHLTQLQGMTPYAQSKGLPAPKASVVISGLMILAGGLSVLLGVWLEIGLWLLILFLLAAAFKMHNYWAVTDPMQKATEQAQFMKNLAIAGGALIYYWMVQSMDTYGPFVLGSPM